MTAAVSTPQFALEAVVVEAGFTLSQLVEFCVRENFRGELPRGVGECIDPIRVFVPPFLERVSTHFAAFFPFQIFFPASAPVFT